jgi:hypothetical protein
MNATVDHLREQLQIGKSVPVVPYTIRDDQVSFSRAWLTMRRAWQSRTDALGGMCLAFFNPADKSLVACWLYYDRPEGADANHPATIMANYKDVRDLFGMLVVRLQGAHPRKTKSRPKLCLPVLIHDTEMDDAAIGWFELADVGDGHPGT